LEKEKNHTSSEPNQEFNLNKDRLDRFSGGGIQTNRDLEEQSIINKDMSGDFRQLKAEDFVGVKAELFLDGGVSLKQEFKNSINSHLAESLLS
jgi:hypothetical protein